MAASTASILKLQVRAKVLDAVGCRLGDEGALSLLEEESSVLKGVMPLGPLGVGAPGSSLLDVMSTAAAAMKNDASRGVNQKEAIQKLEILIGKEEAILKHAVDEARQAQAGAQMEFEGVSKVITGEIETVGAQIEATEALIMAKMDKFAACSKEAKAAVAGLRLVADGCVKEQNANMKSMTDLISELKVADAIKSSLHSGAINMDNLATCPPTKSAMRKKERAARTDEAAAADKAEADRCVSVVARVLFDYALCLCARSWSFHGVPRAFRFCLFSSLAGCFAVRWLFSSSV